MDVWEAIQGRRSIRKYSARGVESEKINQILEAGRLAPSASNSQQWKFIAVTDADKLGQNMAQACGNQQFVAKAPAVLVVCATQANRMMTCGQPAETVDASIALSFMILEAWELGLGGCWLGHFYEDKVKALLGIPDAARVVAVAPLGYPAETPAPRPRKKAEEVISHNRY